MDEILKRDQNFVTVLGGITNDSDQDITMLRVDPITKRLLISADLSGVVVTSLNGLTGAITLAGGTNITLGTVGQTITINAANQSPSIGGSITGGTANSVLFVNPTGILAQDNANFSFTSSTLTQQIGSVSTSGQAITKIKGGALSGSSATDNFLNITGQMPASNSAAIYGVNITITGNGSSTANNRAVNVDYNAGYTGVSTNIAIRGANANAGTGTGGWTNGTGNYGGNFISSGATAGHNVGNFARALGSTVLNIGVLGHSIATAATLNVGTAGMALTATTNVGGFFGLMSTAPTLTISAAIVADNGAVATDIAQFRDNGTTVVTIADGGATTVNTTLTTGAATTGGQGTTIINGNVLGGASVTDNFLTITGTLPAVTTNVTNGVNMTITSAGSSANVPRGLLVQLGAGYTGSSQTVGIAAINNVLGTGASAFTGSGNISVTSNTSGQGTGHNIGLSGNANGSSALNLANLNRAISATNSPTLNVASANFALNATTNVAGFFGLMSTAPTISTSSALIADNGTQAVDIFQARDNGTVVVSIVDGGNVGIGTTPSYPLHVSTTIAGASSDYAAFFNRTSTNPVTFSGGEYSRFQSTQTSSFSGENYSLVGEQWIAGNGSWTGNGNQNQSGAVGVMGRVEDRSGTHTVSNAQSFISQAELQTNATWTNYMGYRALVPTGAGTITNAYGFYTNALTKGTNIWAFYQAGTENNYFGGNIGIGQTTPTARLHLAAGTSTASTAPLKFTSGTNLTTAEAGAVEFTTDDYYATITTGAARKGIVLNDGSNLTSGRIPFATTNGRVTDDADMTFATDTLTVTKISTGTLLSTGVVRLKGYTVATLPAGTQGDTAFVTDALAPTFLTTVVGGGAIVTTVFYNGTNWIAQ